MSEMTTLLTFTFSHEALPVKALLESNNIICFLKDELTVQQQPLWSQAIGGVKLQVRNNQVANAKQILEDNGYKVESQQQELYIGKLNEKKMVKWMQVCYKIVATMIVAGIFYLIYSLIKK